MTTTAGQTKRLRVALLGALATLCFAGVAGSSAPGAAALGTGCAYADATPRQATPKQLRNALACLINAERAKRDRRQLRGNRPLRRIAQRHTKVMLEQDCFRHTCPGERTLRKRIANSGYVQPGGRFGYGENLGCSRTPAGMVAAWMSSSFHRRNILDRKFRHVGVGGKRGSPYPGGTGSCSPPRRYMTYAVIFGWRKRAS